MAALDHTTELAMYIELALTPRINGLNLYLLTDRRGGIRCTARCCPGIGPVPGH